MALVNQVDDVTPDQLLNREDLFISRHEIEVQVHPIPILTHPCLRSLPIRKQCDSCYVLSLKLLDCCGYLFISGHANKVQVHPIPCLKISFDEDIFISRHENEVHVHLDIVFQFQLFSSFVPSST